MKDPRNIRISDYTYPLPDERIARFPLAERDASKLLVFNHGNISHTVFTDLPSLLPEGSLMVMNNTRVIQARLHFTKDTGACIEVFCLEPALPTDYVLMFQQTSHCSWHCLVGNSKRWKNGSLTRTVSANSRSFQLSCSRGEGDVIDFEWSDPSLTWAEVLEAVGELPIPPYLNRATEASDLTTYQTVYSKVKGSVAAPTAGLHFTERVLSDIESRGIERAELTLHVGAGTFKPVKSEQVGGHEMHSEWIYVPLSVIEALLRHGCECTAVGTTSVRTLESLYYIGIRILHNPEATEADLHVCQWEPYELPEADRAITTEQALKAIRSWLTRHDLTALHTSTQIIIAPGYEFHIVQRMITNFHQPQSTLLLLVSAFVGDGRWRAIYDYALNNDFRFLSYGDSSILFRPTPELLPLVDETGRVIGTAPRDVAHEQHLLHPVVHLHVFNSNGEIYLQHRPAWKKVQPDRWDSAVGGHIDAGETVEQALLRETREEIGIEGFDYKPLPMYVFECEQDRELVYPFVAVYDKPIYPSDELDGGRFWTRAEIEAAIGTGQLTPNFEQEYIKYLNS